MRRALRLALLGSAAVLATLALAACGGSDEKIVSGTFVGAVPGSDVYVAVVAAESDEGADERAIRVYACDAKSISEWFPTAGGNDFAADSEGGDSHVEATLEGDEASGTLELDGESFPFTATRATGIAGLYDTVAQPDGSIRGSSETGARVEGTRTQQPNEQGGFEVTGTYTTADGTTEPFSHSVGTMRFSDGGTVESRVIVLADGSRRGAPKPISRRRVEGNGQPQ